MPHLVNPFDPIEPDIIMERYQDGTVARRSLGIPLRLALAGQTLASNPFLDPGYCLDLADKLIAEHNQDVLEREGTKP